MTDGMTISGPLYQSSKTQVKWDNLGLFRALIKGCVVI